MEPAAHQRSARRPEEFIHYRGKNSRVSKPLAIDLRPRATGRDAWQGVAGRKCRPHGDWPEVFYEVCDR